MRNGVKCYSRTVSDRAPSQPHRLRAFTLMEVLVGLVIAALVVGLGVGLVTSWTQASRSLPRGAARGASDAQVQQMVAELRNAVAVSYIAPNEVIAIINTAGNASTPPSVGGTPTGAYQVAYYYSSGVLYRNGGARAHFGAANGVTAAPPNPPNLPVVPRAPAVDPPGPPPQQPTCVSPCYDPTGAYVSYYNVTAGPGWVTGGGVVYYRGQHGNGIWFYGGHANPGAGCTSFYLAGTGQGLSAPVGGISVNVPASNPTTETVLRVGGWAMCDFTDNGPEINGTMVGVRVLRGAEAIYYMPINSKTAYYYLPSCSCNLSQSGYTTDQTNWSNYQSELSGYSQQLQAWQGAQQQWSTYSTNYRTYLGQVTQWNHSNASALTGQASRAPSASGTMTTGGGWAPNWQTIADALNGVTFTGYTSNMTATTGPSAVQAIGISVQYAGQPTEQEMLRLTGSQQLNAFSTKPLVIPPAPPDQRGQGPVSAYNGWSGQNGGGTSTTQTVTAPDPPAVTGPPTNGALCGCNSPVPSHGDSGPCQIGTNSNSGDGGG